MCIYLDLKGKKDIFSNFQGKREKGKGRRRLGLDAFCSPSPPPFASTQGKPSLYIYKKTKIRIYVYTYSLNEIKRSAYILEMILILSRSIYRHTHRSAVSGRYITQLLALEECELGGVEDDPSQSTRAHTIEREELTSCNPLTNRNRQ